MQSKFSPPVHGRGSATEVSKLFRTRSCKCFLHTVLIPNTLYRGVKFCGKPIIKVFTTISNGKVVPLGRSGGQSIPIQPGVIAKVSWPQTRTVNGRSRRVASICLCVCVWSLILFQRMRRYLCDGWPVYPGVYRLSLLLSDSPTELWSPLSAMGRGGRHGKCVAAQQCVLIYHDNERSQLKLAGPTKRQNNRIFL